MCGMQSFLCKPIKNTIMIKPHTTDYTLSFSKEIGKLWTLDDVTPFHVKFRTYFIDKMGRDICKITSCGAGNLVLDILSGGANGMQVELRISNERIEMPGYVEFELIRPCSLAAKYHVNNCPGRPQLEAWFNASVKQIVSQYPPFPHIRKIA